MRRGARCGTRAGSTAHVVRGHSEIAGIADLVGGECSRREGQEKHGYDCAGGGSDEARCHGFLSRGTEGTALCIGSEAVLLERLRPGWTPA